MKTETSQKSSILIRRIEDSVEFEKLGNDWKALYHECNCREAFLTWEWMFAWWKHYQQGKGLWLITAWQDNTLCGIAPLMLVNRQKSGLMFRSLRQISQPDNDIAGFIIRDNAPEIMDAIYSYIASQRKNWDLIELDELPVDAPETRRLLSFFQKSGCDTREKIFPHYYLPIAGSWESFFDALDLAERGFLKKNLERAKKSGEVNFRRFIGKELTWEHFLEVFRINQQGSFPQLYQDAERGFLEELFELTREVDFLEIDFMQLKDEFIAFNLGFTVDKRHEGWRTGYDKNYSKIGPGRNMFMLLLQSFFNQGYSELDFLRGEEVYKGSWKPSAREYVNIRVVPRTKIITRLAFIWLPKLKALLNKWTSALKKKNADEKQSA